MLDTSWIAGIVLYAIVVVLYLPVSCHILPGPIEPGSGKLFVATSLSGLITIGVLAALVERNVDPYPFGIIYSSTLMLLCVEVWFLEDPSMFNGSAFKGFPFFLFHRPGDTSTMAPVPMASYTRVFGTWHAGGVCLCFFMHVLANDFPQDQKAQTSLALGLLWLIWATINQWRSIYGGEQFCQMGILIHSLVGPGCGLCGFWQLWFWQTNRTSTYNNYAVNELILLGTFALLALVAFVFWVVAMKKRSSVSTSTTDDDHDDKKVLGEEGIVSARKNSTTTDKA